VHFSELESVNTQRPIVTEGEHRVLQFRPRAPTPHPADRRRSNVALQSEPAEMIQLEPLDLSRYEQAQEQPDDYRRRMLANIAAFAFTVALTAVGIWLAISIADLRRTQDCVLMGRRDCVHISTQPF
jgi:hypothetical protein